ncbi:hypothetical protein IMZ48_11580 [Candidatus Bathyarchaeota archaeon]|nr:hypothetical protein [Candidatus Bathyarchaeota archaeon]
MQLRSLMKRIGAILLLQVLLISPAQACARWGGVSSSAQSPLRIMSAHLTVTKPYTRVRMTSLPDADVAYPLIATYLSNPELAHSVEEFVAQVDGSAYLGSLHDPAAQDRLPVLVGESDHEVIRRHIDTLGLSPETVRTMKGAIDWWRRTALARPSKPVRASLLCYDVSREEEKLYREYASTATALLLSLCPNISTLHLGGIGIYEHTLEEYLLKSNYGLSPRPALQNLRHVEHYPSKPSLDYDAYDEVQLLDHFRYFHRLPRISSVSMEGVTNAQGWREIFPPRTSEGIKRIDFQHVDIPGWMLATLVRIPTTLEQLSVSLGGFFHSEGGVPMVNVGLLGRSLEQHIHTLRVLDLDLGSIIDFWNSEDDTEDWDEEDWEERFEDERISEEGQRDGYFELDDSVSQGPLYPRDVRSLEDHGRLIMTFRDYTALTHLSLNLEAILGPTGYVEKVVRIKLASRSALALIDALPPSLEYLCLYGYTKGKIPEFDEQVEELMANMGERLPKLVEVRGVDKLERVIDPDSDENDEDRTSRWTTGTYLEWVEA